MQEIRAATGRFLAVSRSSLDYWESFFLLAKAPIQFFCFSHFSLLVFFLVRDAATRLPCLSLDWRAAFLPVPPDNRRSADTKFRTHAHTHTLTDWATFQRRGCQFSLERFIINNWIRSDGPNFYSRESTADKIFGGGHLVPVLSSPHLVI